MMELQAGFNVWLEKDGRYLIGEKEAQLLEKVQELGSIRMASKALGTTYAHAWNTLEGVKVLLGDEVVKARRGGRSGGGASLTAKGLRLLQQYKRLKEKVASSLPKGYQLPARTVLFKPELSTPDLVVIGSHCKGVEILLRLLSKEEYSYEVSYVGSSGGLAAIMLGEADIAGVHLLDEQSGVYNLPFLRMYWISDRAVVVRGYLREQGLIVKKGNPKNIIGFKDLLRNDVKMVNRELGSGTRALLDMHLKRLSDEMGIRLKDLTGRIKGYDFEVMSHSKAVEEVRSGRADVALGIKAYADPKYLDFILLAEENFDFIIEERRFNKSAVRAFIKLLKSEDFKKELMKSALGIKVTKETGKVIYKP